MSNIKGDYKFSALGVILFGVAGIVLGDIGWALAGSVVADVLRLVGLGGIVLLIIGIVRAVSERRKRQELGDQAARTIVNGGNSQLSLADELRKLDELRSSGALTDDEFREAKSKLIR